MPLESIENVVANRKKRSTSSSSSSSYANKFFDDCSDHDCEQQIDLTNKENVTTRRKKKIRRVDEEEEFRSCIIITKIQKKNSEIGGGPPSPTRDPLINRVAIVNKTLSRVEEDISTPPRLDSFNHVSQSSFNINQIEERESLINNEHVVVDEPLDDLDSSRVKSVKLFEADSSESESEDEDESIIFKRVAPRKNKQPSKRTTTPKNKKTASSREKRLKKEAEERREREEEAIEAWYKEWKEIEDYKLVVETGPHD